MVSHRKKLRGRELGCNMLKQFDFCTCLHVDCDVAAQCARHSLGQGACEKGQQWQMALAFLQHMADVAWGPGQCRRVQDCASIPSPDVKMVKKIEIEWENILYVYTLYLIYVYIYIHLCVCVFITFEMSILSTIVTIFPALMILIFVYYWCTCNRGMSFKSTTSLVVRHWAFAWLHTEEIRPNLICFNSAISACEKAKQVPEPPESQMENRRKWIYVFFWWTWNVEGLFKHFQIVVPVTGIMFGRRMKRDCLLGVSRCFCFRLGSWVSQAQPT